MARSETCPAQDKKCKSCGKVAMRINAVRTGDQLSEQMFFKVKDSSSSEEDVWQINSIGKSLNETEVLVGETPTKFVIDSGAGVNIIDSHSFDKLSQNEDLSLRSTDMKLFTYGSNTPLKLRGKINCEISYKDESVPADIYVEVSRYS